MASKTRFDHYEYEYEYTGESAGPRAAFVDENEARSWRDRAEEYTEA